MLSIDENGKIEGNSSTIVEPPASISSNSTKHPKGEHKIFWDTGGRTEYEPPTAKSMVLDDAGQTLTTEQQKQLDELKAEFPDLYSKDKWDIGCIDRKYGELVVELEEGKTIKYGNRMPKISYQEEQWLSEDVDNLLGASVIAPTVDKGG